MPAVAGLTVAAAVGSHRAEERDEERHAEVGGHAAVYRHGHEPRAACVAYHGQRGVHGRGPCSRYGCQCAEQPYEQRCPEQCNHLAHNV